MKYHHAGSLVISPSFLLVRVLLYGATFCSFFGIVLSSYCNKCVNGILRLELEHVEAISWTIKILVI